MSWLSIVYFGIDKETEFIDNQIIHKISICIWGAQPIRSMPMVYVKMS